MKRTGALWVWLVLAGSWLAMGACGDGGAAADDSAPVITGDVDADDIEAAPAEIFLRQPVSENGQLQLLHIVVSADASREGVRQMLFERLSQEGRNNPEVAALRAIVYVPRQRGQDEAELEPVAWGEWVPPEGFAAATLASRSQYYRVYSYFDAPPEW